MDQQSKDTVEWYNDADMRKWCSRAWAELNGATEQGHEGTANPDAVKRCS